jgi:hypothetical protein
MDQIMSLLDHVIQHWKNVSLKVTTFPLITPQSKSICGFMSLQHCGSFNLPNFLKIETFISF